MNNEREAFEYWFCDGNIDNMPFRDIRNGKKYFDSEIQAMWEAFQAGREYERTQAGKSNKCELCGLPLEDGKCLYKTHNMGDEKAVNSSRDGGKPETLPEAAGLESGCDQPSPATPLPDDVVDEYLAGADAYMRGFQDGQRKNANPSPDDEGIECFRLGYKTAKAEWKQKVEGLVAEVEKQIGYHEKLEIECNILTGDTPHCSKSYVEAAKANAIDEALIIIRKHLGE